MSDWLLLTSELTRLTADEGRGVRDMVAVGYIVDVFKTHSAISPHDYCEKPGNMNLGRDGQ